MNNILDMSKIQKLHFLVTKFNFWFRNSFWFKLKK